jgi:hypothetical protein
MDEDALLLWNQALRKHRSATADKFNNRRLLEPIGNIPPAEAEQRYRAAVTRSDLLGAPLGPDSISPIGRR